MYGYGFGTVMEGQPVKAVEIPPNIKIPSATDRVAIMGGLTKLDIGGAMPWAAPPVDGKPGPVIGTYHPIGTAAGAEGTAAPFVATQIASGYKVLISPIFDPSVKEHQILLVYANQPLTQVAGKWTILSPVEAGPGGVVRPAGMLGPVGIAVGVLIVGGLAYWALAPKERSYKSNRRRRYRRNEASCC